MVQPAAIIPSQLERVPLYPEEAAAAPATVCVTGASGFVAGPLVERLLASGHTVHATVRRPDDEAAVGCLKALPGAAERLKLFKADLLVAGSFDEAVAGCDYVIHTASPFIINVKRGQARSQLVEPAVKGVEHVLAAVEKSPSVKRVVLTSSVAAMYANPHEHGEGHVINEADWNKTSTELVLPYSLSKKMAELRAWELAKAQDRWQLVTINPALVLGPPVGSRADGESVTIVAKMMAGEMYPAAPMAGMGWVDVRDVAAAHCLAMVHPAAQGRNVTVSGTVLLADLAGVVADLYPNSSFKRPLFLAPKWLVWLVGPLAGMPRDAVTHTLGYVPRFDSSKIQTELGLKFLDIKVTIADMIEDMARKGLVKRPK